MSDAMELSTPPPGEPPPDDLFFVGVLDDDSTPAAPAPMEIEALGGISFKDPLLNFLGSVSSGNGLVADAANLLIGYFEHILREVKARRTTSLDLNHLLEWYLGHLPRCVFICTKGRPLMLAKTWRALAPLFGSGERRAPDMAKSIGDLGYPVIEVECLSILSRGVCKPGERPEGRADDAGVIFCALLGDPSLSFGVLTGDKCTDTATAPELRLELSFNDGVTTPVGIDTYKTQLPPYTDWEWHPDDVRKAIEDAAGDYFL